MIAFIDICAAQSYFDRYGTPAHPQDLARHRCLVYSVQPSPSQWWFKDESGRFSVEVEAYMSANDWASVYDAAVNGLGIARILSRSLVTPQLIPIFQEFVESDRGVWAFYPRTQPVPKKSQLMLEFLQRHLAAV